MRWVLDSSAVLYWLKGEPGALRVTEILSSTDPVLMHAVNLVDVRYYLQRRTRSLLDRGMERIAATSIQIK